MTPDPASGRWLRALAIAAVIALGVVTCARREAAPGTGPRIVSIGGAVTEIIYALGAGDRVVAVDTSSVYPAEATHLPQLGYLRSLAAEAVLAQAPDLVIASADAGPPAAIAQLRAAGVALALIPIAQTPEAAAARIRAVGDALHVAPKARAMAELLLADTRTALTNRDARHPRAVLIYARGAGTLMVAGAGTAGGAMLELAGATNAASGFHGYKTLSPEILVESAPEVIVVPSRGLETLGGEAALLGLPGVAETPAGKAHRFVALDDLLLLGFGPRLPAAIRALAAKLPGN